MKITITTAFTAFFVACIYFVAPAQSLNSVLTSHYAAMGQNVRSGIRSMLLEIKEENELNEEKKYSIIKKRPNKIRIEGVWKKQNYISAFDGIRAWTIAPWTGVSIPQLMTMTEMDDIKSQDGIDSPIYRSQQNGDDISYSGTVLENDNSFHVLKVNSIENPYMEYYLHEDSYLLYKSIRYDRVDTAKVSEQVIYKNYEVQKIPGQGDFNMAMVLESVKDDVKLDIIIEEVIIGFGAPNSFFTKPE